MPELGPQRTAMLPTAQATSLHRFSSSAIAPQDRLARWRDELGRSITGCLSRPEREGDFSVDWVSNAGAGVRIGTAKLVNLRNDRTTACLSDGDEDFTLFVMEHGLGQVEQQGAHVQLRPGDMMLTTHARPILTSWDDSVVATVRLTRGDFGRQAPDAALGRVLNGASPLHGLLLAYLREARTMAYQAGEMPPIAERHVMELLTALTHNGGVATPADARAPDQALARAAARVAVMRETMRRRFAEPTLRMRDVAASAGLSGRAGYLAFEATGAMFANELIDIRLDRAREALRSTQRLRITDIAMACGFSDLSYFNRRFKQRFGCTPSDVQRARDP
jgi:AraC-like DNA-binding protein